MSGVREIKKIATGSIFEQYQSFLQDSSAPNPIDLFSLGKKPTEGAFPDIKKSFGIRAFAQEINPDHTNPARDDQFAQRRALQTERIERYTKAIENEPGEAKHYINLGRVYLEQGEEELAEKNFREAIHIDEDNPDGYFYLAEVCYLKQDLKEALVNYNEAFNHGNRNPRLFFVRGYLFNLFDQPDSALENYQKALEINPEYISVYQQRAQLRQKLGDNEGAISDYYEIIERDLFNEEAYVHLAILLEARNKLPKALEIYDLGLKHNPQSWIIHANRADTYQRLGQIDLAIKDYQQAIAIDPKDISSLEKLAQLADQQGNKDQALKYYEAIAVLNYDDDFLKSDVKKSTLTQEEKLDQLDLNIKKNPKEKSHYLQRAKLWEKKSQWAKAAIDYETYLKLDPHNTLIEFQLGIAYLNSDEVNKAHQVARKILQTNPDHAKALYLQALVMIKKGNLKRALSDLDLSIEKDPHNALVYIARGDVLIKLNEQGDALTDYNQAARLSPEQSEIYQRRAKALWSYQKSEILVNLEKALEIDPENIEAHQDIIAYHLKYKNYQRLRFHLAQASQIETNSASFYQLLAKVYESFDFEKSIKAYTKAIQLNPEQNDLYKRRAYLYLCTGNFQIALEDYHYLVKKEPKNLYHRINRGRAFKAMGDFENALKDFDFVLANNNQFGAVFFWKGEINFLQGKTDEALIDMNQGITLAPDNSTFYFGRAQVLESIEKYDDALKDYDQAITLYDQNPRYYIGRGRVYKKLGQKEEALTNYKRAHDLNKVIETEVKNPSNIKPNIKEILETLDKAVFLQPDNPLIYYQRSAFLKENLINYDAETKDIDYAISLDPFNDIFLHSRSASFGIFPIYPRDKRFSQTKKDLEILIQRNPENLYYYAELAHTLIKEDAHKEAIEVLNQYLKIKVNDPEFYLLRGQIRKISKEDIKLKIRDYELSVKYSNGNPKYLKEYFNIILTSTSIEDRIKFLDKYYLKKDAEYFYFRSSIYASQGEYQEAISDLTKAINLSTRKIKYYLERASIYLYHLHDYDKALADFSKVIAIDPENQAAIYKRISIYRYRNHNNSVLDDLKLLLKAYQQDSNQYVNIIWKLTKMYIELGNFEIALTLVNDIEIPKKTDLSFPIGFLLERAELNFSFGHIDQTIKDIDRFSDYIREKKESLKLINQKTDFEREYLKYSQGKKINPDFEIFLLTRYLEKYPDEKWIYFLRAKLYIKEGKYQPALADLHKTPSSLIRKNYLEYFYLRGICYQQTGNYKNAISDLTRALLARNNEYSDRKIIKELIESYEKRGAFQGEDWLLQHLQEHPKVKFSFMFYFESAQRRMKRGEYEKALADINKAIVINPKENHALYLRIKIFQYLGNITLALRDINNLLRALEFNGKFSGWLHLEKSRLLGKSNYQEIDILEGENNLIYYPLSKHRESHFENYLDLINYWSEYPFYHYEDEVRIYDRYLTIKPGSSALIRPKKDDADFYLAKAKLSTKYEYHDLALKDLLKLKRILNQEHRPPKLEDYLALTESMAETYQNLSQIDPAYEQYDDLVKKYPQSYEAAKSYADFAKKNHQHQKAKKILEKFIKKNPQQFIALRELALLLENDDIDLAITTISKAISIYPSNEFYYLRAKFYFKKHDNDQAIRDLNQIIGTNSPLQNEAKKMKAFILLGNFQIIEGAKVLFR